MMRVLELDHAKMLDYAEAQIHSAIESLRKGEKRLEGNTYDSSAYNRFKPLLEDLHQAQNS